MQNPPSAQGGLRRRSSLNASSYPIFLARPEAATKVDDTVRGFCFPPEIGDEVLVQFHDESTAFIISAAWNDKELPPLEELHGKEVDNNDIKRLVTKSGNRLVMDDKEVRRRLLSQLPSM